MKNVIVTGANGFVGSNLVNKLAEKEIHVFALVRDKATCKINNNKYITIIQCKMDEYKEAEKIFEDIKIDVFYHYAWAGTTGNRRSDYKLQLENVEYTCDAIKLAKKLEIKKFIFAGSIIEYEYTKCIQEKGACLGLNNVYGIAKLTARHMGKTLADEIGIEFIQTTISNIYGPGEVSPRLLNTTLRRMLSGERTKFTTCEQLYDFIYIDDAVEAYYMIGLYGKKNNNYYIGNKKPKKLKEFICEIRNCINKELEIGFGEIEFNGVSLSYNEFNTNLIYDELGFSIKNSFENGIKKTIKWIVEERG